MSDDETRALADRYDRESRAYEELWAPVLRVAGAQLVDALAIRSADRVLDVATGVGALLPVLRGAFPSAYISGVDRSLGMLSLASRSYPRAVTDATRLAIASNSMDLVVLAFVLFHLPSPIDGLREARRVLRAGGRAGSITWASELESAATRVWKECLDDSGAPEPESAAAARHAAVDDPRKVETLYRDAGFTSVRAWIGQLAYPIGPEHLVSLRTRIGASKPRFDALDPDQQAMCVAVARRRFESLGPEDFVATAQVVYAVADR